MIVEMRFPIIIIVLLCIFFTACEEEEGDYSISEITIYNIPAKIPVNGNESEGNNTFKVYLNASNSKAAEDFPVAKGVAKISDGKLESDGKYKGTYTVTIKLQKPNPKNGMDPNLPTGPWSGEASFFLIVLSPQSVPQNVTSGVNLIWAKTGFTLDIGKEKCDWEDKKIFINFRDSALAGAMGLDTKTQELFMGIVLQDPDINKGPSP